MRTKFNLLVATMALVASVLTSCVSGETYYRAVETKLVSADPSGVCDLRVQGTALSPYTAYLNACKKAVEEVLFNKDLRSEGGFATRVEPVFFNTDVRKNNEMFFNNFFRDGGAYERFLIGNRFLGNRFARKIITRGEKTYSYETSLKVDRAALKNYMIQSGLLSK